MVNKENAIKLLELEISNMEYAIELAEKIKPIVEKFNGKVLNKRLETALREVDKHIDMNNGHRFEICYYCENCRITFNKEDMYNSRTEYVKQRELYLTDYLTTNTDRKSEENKCVVDENNRIKADVIIKGIERKQEYYRKEIDKIKNGLPKVDEYKQRIETIKNELEELQQEIPFWIKAYFELHYTIKQY